MNRRFLIQSIAALTAFVMFSILSSKTEYRPSPPAISASVQRDTTHVDSTLSASRNDSTNALSNSFPRPFFISHGLRSEKNVALTFDACATIKISQYDSSIVRLLIETNTPATLFLSGKWMMEHQKETKQLAAVPFFEIGNHTNMHPHMTVLKESEMRQELEDTQAILQKLTGRQADLYRPPFGETSDSVQAVAKSLGLVTVQYDVASGDPDSSFDAKRLVNSVIDNVKNGSIVVMHINRRGWHTAEALPEIVARLKQRGFQFVKVSDLLQDLSKQARSEAARDTLLKSF
jgi:peptidoglycan/xylan/chitin deacetylase (PgdA/CDA1 family)